jgi:hypothetical protein
MNRSCVWICTLTAATAAMIAEARAFTLNGPGTPRLAHFIAGPELRGPGASAGGSIKPPSPPSGSYSFSGNSFNLSVTKSGRPPPPTSPSAIAPGGGGERPGLFRQFFNWITGD